MTVDKPGEIVRRAMADRTVYNAMVAAEKKLWGKTLPNRERSKAAAEDSKAAPTLGICRHQSSLIRVASDKALKFEHGLTLGCGAGRCERELISRGVCRGFHGIDLPESAIEMARETAKEQGLQLTYEVADLNFVQLPEKTHGEANLAFPEKRWLSLNSRFHRRNAKPIRAKHLAIINEILAILPEKFRRNRMNNRVTTEIKRPEPGTLASPFESIRSSEIIPIFERWFTIEWKRGV
jgi:hypothetical protein